jgi:L-ascorbate metabolism protein UlaG (beta-lactamase superfamily)
VSSKPLRAKADIVTISQLGNPVHGHIDAIQGEPFVIDHPGEFELKGIYVQGVAVPMKDPKKSTTIFWLDVEGMRVVHLGNLETMLSADVLEKMDGVDILMLPVGGSGLELKQAVKLVNDIEPRVVIPMHYAQEGVNIGTKLGSVSAFLKEMGASNVKPIDRMLFKKKDLPDAEDTQVIVFSN